MIVLETERLFLREWVSDDWIRFKPLATDLQTLKYVGDGRPLTDEQIKDRVNQWMALSCSRGWIQWPIIHREDARLIGFCGFADSFPPGAEMGWRLLPEYWGRGLATEIASAVLEFGFTRWAFPHVCAIAQKPNHASIRIMQKLGMSFTEDFDRDGRQLVRYEIGRSRTADRPRPLGGSTHDSSAYG